MVWSLLAAGSVVAIQPLYCGHYLSFGSVVATIVLVVWSLPEYVGSSVVALQATQGGASPP